MFCQKCGKLIPEGAGKIVDEHLLCPDCAAASVKCFCQRCGCELPPDTPLQENGRLLCENCAALPDDSEQNEAFWEPAPLRRDLPKLGMLPVWIAALTLVIVVGAVAALFGTKTLCIHAWEPATCQTAEVCKKCGRIHGDPLPHKWKDATCTEPRTCMNCGETEGEPAGHVWIDATCTAPRTCLICGETEGKPAGHQWEAATCQKPMTCSVCGEEQGKLGSHKWKDATCEEPRTCEICGETDGEAPGHSWIPATCTEPKTCEVCGKTDGKPAGHKWLDATVLSPKTCEICGETEGEALDILTLDPIDLMDVTKEDFIGATGDAHHEPVGCPECAGNSSTLVSDVFEGCVLAFGSADDSLPSHIHVFNGNVTESTKIGMTYKALSDALGEPTWSLSDTDRTATAIYNINGNSVGFVFDDKKLMTDMILYEMGLTKKLRISNTSMKVISAIIE
ncbi:MAG: hypothetical protein II916_03675 [Oscillospiraceae bacterium]|nr:hypothetical protein [Oscillospiraceae bacterium]